MHFPPSSVSLLTFSQILGGIYSQGTHVFMMWEWKFEHLQFFVCFFPLSDVLWAVLNTYEVKRMQLKVLQYLQVGSHAKKTWKERSGDRWQPLSGIAAPALFNDVTTWITTLKLFCTTTKLGPQPLEYILPPFVLRYVQVIFEYEFKQRGQFPLVFYVFFKQA